MASRWRYRAAFGGSGLDRQAGEDVESEGERRDRKIRLHLTCDARPCLDAGTRELGWLEVSDCRAVNCR